MNDILDTYVINSIKDLNDRVRRLEQHTPVASLLVGDRVVHRIFGWVGTIVLMPPGYPREGREGVFIWMRRDNGAYFGTYRRKLQRID